MRYTRFFLLLALSLALVFGCGALAEEDDQVPRVALNLNEHYFYSTEDGTEVRFVFTPEQTGLYEFNAVGGKYMHARLYPENSSRFYHGWMDEGVAIVRGVLQGGASSVVRLDIYNDSSCTVEAWIQPVQSRAVYGDNVPHDHVTYGEPETLTVYACNPDGGIIYEWYTRDPDTEAEALIDGADQSAYTIPAVTQNMNYTCKAYTTDGESIGSALYTVHIDPNLTVKSVYESLFVSPGEVYTMTVQAHADYGEIYYQWYQSGSFTNWNWESLENETGPSLTITDQIIRYTNYYCEITSYDHSTTLTKLFSVEIDNSLSISTNQSGYTVSPGDSVVLSAEATCNVGDIHYQWFQWKYDSTQLQWSYEEIAGETGPSLTLNNIQASREYRVEATDNFESSISQYFDVEIPNGLTIEPTCDESYYLKEGDTVTLSVQGHCVSGGVTYQWYQHGEPIPGATGNTYTYTMTGSSAFLTCNAIDQYQNTDSTAFNIDLLEEFSAWAPGNRWITLSPNETKALTVKAHSESGASITYTWSLHHEGEGEGFTPIEGANSASLTVVGQGGSTEYCCTVSDSMGNSDEIYFTVEVVSGLNVAYNWKETIQAGQSATLSVDALSDYGPITYQWYQEGEERMEPIPGATDASYETGALNNRLYLQCLVSDGYQTETCYFTIDVVDPTIVVRPIGETNIQCQEGDEITLAVSATGNFDEDGVTFSWEKNGDRIDLDQPGPSYTFRASAESSHYVCYAFANGREYDVHFFVSSSAIPALSLDQPVSVTASRDESPMLSFTPGSTGMYAFSIDSGTLKQSGCNLTVYDSDWKEVYGAYQNSFSVRLTGGQTYYLSISCSTSNKRSGAIVVRTASDGRTGAFTLIAGQRFVFPELEGHSLLPVSSVSDAPGVVKMVNEYITAVAPGTAHVTVTYDNGYELRYTVTVVAQGQSTLRVPVATILPETFAGGSSIQYASVRGSNIYIGSKAFQGTSLKQIIIDSYYVYVASDAFSGASPLIVGVDDDLQEFAEDHGFVYLLIREAIGGNG